MGDLWRVYLPTYLSRTLSLTVPLWVGAMNILAMVTATAEEETASSAYQWAILPGVLA